MYFSKLNMHSKTCPKEFDTEGLFVNSYNSDPNCKCIRPIEYTSGSKLNGSTVEDGQFVVDTSEIDTQTRTHADGQFGFDIDTKGNFGNLRAGVSKDLYPLNFGECTDKTLNNTSNYRDATAPPSRFIDPSSYRSFGVNPLAGCDKKRRKKEHFGRKPGPYPNNTAYSSDPYLHVNSSATDGMTNYSKNLGNIADADDDYDNEGVIEDIRNGLIAKNKDALCSDRIFNNFGESFINIPWRKEKMEGGGCINAIDITLIVIVGLILLIWFGTLIAHFFMRSTPSNKWLVDFIGTFHPYLASTMEIKEGEEKKTPETKASSASSKSSPNASSTPTPKSSTPKTAENSPAPSTTETQQQGGWGRHYMTGGNTQKRIIDDSKRNNSQFVL